MNQRITAILLVLTVLATPVGSVASPRSVEALDAGRLIAPAEAYAHPAKDEVSLSEAVARVKREYGGRILEAETKGQNGRRVHVIKVLTKEGRVRTVRIPAGGNGGR